MPFDYNSFLQGVQTGLRLGRTKLGRQPPVPSGRYILTESGEIIITEKVVDWDGITAFSSNTWYELANPVIMGSKTYTQVIYKAAVFTEDGLQYFDFTMLYGTFAYINNRRLAIISTSQPLAANTGIRLIADFKNEQGDEGRAEDNPNIDDPSITGEGWGYAFGRATYVGKHTDTLYYMVDSTWEYMWSNRAIFEYFPPAGIEKTLAVNSESDLDDFMANRRYTPMITEGADNG